MIRIGVVSDSHGAMELFEKAVNEMSDVSAIVHLGDCASDALEIARRTGREILTVNGNCDLFSHNPVFRTLDVEGKRIFITHGHREHVKTGLMRLFYRAEEENASLVLYGHTHIQRMDEIDNIMLLNPGAMKDGKYAVVQMDEGGIAHEFHKIGL
ncbi:MAG: metallophosphoesterase [Clostridia bacterium]|nr:metallophosphoesterase [Clostridia bacterium]